MKTKQISVFIGLKIVEIAGIVFIPYYLGKLGLWISPSLTVRDGYLAIWGNGMLMLLLFILVLFLLVGILYGPIRANWRWAGKLTKRN